eukprot:3809890-Heterocapsa_arctica.AAC.1
MDCAAEADRESRNLLGENIDYRKVGNQEVDYISLGEARIEQGHLFCRTSLTLGQANKIKASVNSTG